MKTIMKTNHIKFNLTKSQIKKLNPLIEADHKQRIKINKPTMIIGNAFVTYNLTGKNHAAYIKIGLFSNKVGTLICKHAKGKQINF